MSKNVGPVARRNLLRRRERLERPKPGSRRSTRLQGQIAPHYGELDDVDPTLQASSSGTGVLHAPPSSSRPAAIRLPAPAPTQTKTKAAIMRDHDFDDALIRGDHDEKPHQPHLLSYGTATTTTHTHTRTHTP